MKLLNSMASGRALLLDPAHVKVVSESIFEEIVPETMETITVGGVAASMGPNGKAYMAGSVAVIPVWGVLLHKFEFSGPWATGYNFISDMVKSIRADDSVSGVILDVDSPGGMVMGNFELVSELKDLAAEKPMLAVVNGMATSGAYSIASAANQIVATKSSLIGSIGVVSTHMSFEKLLDKAGIEVTFIYAGKHKVEGNPYQNLSKETKAAIQSSIEKTYETFVNTVAENRGMNPERVRDTEAAVYDAEDALSKGLIDAVQSPNDAVASFINGLSRPSKRGKDMQTQHVTEGLEAPATAPTAEAAAPVEQEAAAPVAEATPVVDQKARIKSIINSDEAKGREEMAEYLAFETDMSAEDALKMLNVAPKAKAVKGNVFENMMDQTEQPGIGPDAGQETVSVADGIVRNFKLVTGRK